MELGEGRVDRTRVLPPLESHDRGHQRDLLGVEPAQTGVLHQVRTVLVVLRGRDRGADLMEPARRARGAPGRLRPDRDRLRGLEEVGGRRATSADVARRRSDPAESFDRCGVGARPACGAGRSARPRRRGRRPPAVPTRSGPTPVTPSSAAAVARIQPPAGSSSARRSSMPGSLSRCASVEPSELVRRVLHVVHRDRVLVERGGERRPSARGEQPRERARRPPLATPVGHASRTRSAMRAIASSTASAPPCAPPAWAGPRARATR